MPNWFGSEKTENPNQTSTELPPGNEQKGPSPEQQFKSLLEGLSARALQDNRYYEAVAVFGALSQNPQDLLNQGQSLRKLLNSLQSKPNPIIPKGEFVESVARYIQGKGPGEEVKVPKEIVVGLFELGEGFMAQYEESRKEQANILSRAEQSGARIYDSINHGDAISEIRLGNQVISLKEPAHSMETLLPQLRQGWIELTARPVPSQTPAPSIEYNSQPTPTPEPPKPAPPSLTPEPAS